MAKIRIKNEVSGDTHKISDETIFGRSEKSSTIAIEDENLSRAHFKIMARNNKAYLIDMESRNGTYINEKQAPANHAYELKHGDLIEAGEQSFTVLIQGQSKEEHNAERDLSSEVYKQEVKPLEKEAVSSVFKIEKRKQIIESGPRSNNDSDASKYYIDEKEFEYDEDEENSELAGFWLRFVAALIDGIISMVTTKVLSTFFLIAMPQFKLNQGVQMWFSIIVGSIVGYIIIIRPLIKTGQSPGKKMVGIKLVTDDYLHPSTAKIIWREYLFKHITTFLSLISLIAFMIDKKNKFIHDHISGTRVIKTNE